MKLRWGKGSQAHHVILQKAQGEPQDFFKASYSAVNFSCWAGGTHIPQGIGKLSGEDKKMVSNSSTECKLLVIIL